jgi:hypothetical protein
MTKNASASNAILPTPGMTVTSRFNSGWGSGTVMMVQGESVRVLFIAHPSRKPVLVPSRSLIVTRPGNWDAAVQVAQQPVRATWASTRSRPGTKKRTFSTQTQDQAIRTFLERYPGGFRGETFVTNERDYKWHAHSLFNDELGGKRLGDLLAKGRLADVVRHALHAEQKTNLLSVFEKARLSQALRHDAYAVGVFRTLVDVLSKPQPEESSFSRYLDAVLNLPSMPGQRNATWPIATILPFLADPKRHLFLKPLATRAAAERLHFDLQYHATPNWKTYTRALQLGSDLHAQLAEHGCRDLIDVQSFMWVMA